MAKRKKNIYQLAIIGVLLVLAATYTWHAFTRPLKPLVPSVTFRLHDQQTKAVALEWPSYGEAAVGAVGYGVLDTHGNQTPLPTASIAKVMTALAVLHEKPMKSGEAAPVITLTAVDVDSYNKYVSSEGSVVKVEEGEQISEYQALQALLLPSANNIAETLARWAFGSVDAYNNYANQYARDLGMTQTTITDPSGFLPSTVSTPSDLILLGEAAIANPVIADVVSQSSAVIPIEGTIKNVDTLLGRDSIVGIKTGNNDQDLGAFLSAATKNVDGQSLQVIGAIMDAPNLDTALRNSLALSQSSGQAFHTNTAIKAGDKVATYSVPWQEGITATVGNTVSLAAWDDSATTASVQLQTLRAPMYAGSAVGTITVKNSKMKTTYASPIILKQALKQPNIFWRLVHPF